MVDKDRVDALQPIRNAADADNLRAYVDAIEKGPDSPASTAWEGTDAIRLRARVAAGQSVSLHVSYDPAWRAESAGRPIPVRKDVLGQMILDAPPGDHDIRLTFELPNENLLGRLASLASAAVLLALVLRR